MATLWAVNENISSAATLTFTLQSIDCGIKTFSKEIWIGAPNPPVLLGPTCFINNSNYALEIIKGGGLDYEWEFPDCEFGDDYPGCWIYYANNGNNEMAYVRTGDFPSSGQPQGNIEITATNPCGSSTSSWPVIWCTDQDHSNQELKIDHSIEDSLNFDEKNIKIYPTFTFNEISIENYSNLSLNFTFYNSYGLPVKSLTTKDKFIKESIEAFPSGVYFIKISDISNRFIVRKIIKL